MCQIDFDAMDIRRHFATSCTFALSIFIIRGETHSLHVASALLFEQHLIPTLRASFCLDLPVSSRLEMRRIIKRDRDARRGATRYGGSVCSRARCRQQTVNCKFKTLAGCDARKNIYTKSDRQAGKAFILCSRVKTLRVGGLFPVIHILVLKKKGRCLK